MSFQLLPIQSDVLDGMKQALEKENKGFFLVCVIVVDELHVTCVMMSYCGNSI